MSASGGSNSTDTASQEGGALSGATLLASVEDWVRGSGHALELRIAEAFGPSATLGLHYRDTVEPAVWRETDVIFTRANQAVSVVTHYVIEAKATNSPWVALEGNRPYLRDESVAETLHHAATHAGLRNLTDLWRSPLFHAGPTAYKLAAMTKRKPGQSERNEAWDATLQVLSATRGLAADAAERLEAHPQPLVELFVPILLTSGPLLVARVATSGLQVEEAAKVLLTGQFPPDGEVRSIWAVQESYLSTLVREAQPVPGLD